MSKTDIGAEVPDKDLAIFPDGKQSPLSGEQIEIIRQTKAKKAKLTTDEFNEFISICQSTGLNPLLNQIYATKRKTKEHPDGILTTLTGIDGYRFVADSTGLYAGSDDYLFNDNQTSFLMKEAKNKTPTSATVTVYKMMGGSRCPFTATALWEEYCPKQNAFMWNQMPYNQLGKCAEALALRKAYPNRLSGVYISEEFDQNREPTTIQPRGAPSDHKQEEDQRTVEELRIDCIEKWQEVLSPKDIAEIEKADKDEMVKIVKAARKAAKEEADKDGV